MTAGGNRPRSLDRIQFFYYLFYLSLLLFSVPSFAWKEDWEPKEVGIGEQAEYLLEFQQGEIQDPEIPSKGMVPDPDAPDLPLFEVISSGVSDTKIKLSVAYYTSGKFSLPIIWKDKDGKEFHSEIVLTVRSSLSEKDKTPEEILPPLEFSGKYGWKLAAILAGLAALGLGIFYAWYLNQTASKRTMDALVEADPWVHKILIYESKLDEIINSPPVFARTFYRVLSGYIRENMSKKMNAPFAHLTEAELFQRIYDSFGLEEEEVRNWENTFRKAQYSGEEVEISSGEALKAWDYWKEALSK
ncbi:hypothetical protein EHQ81_11070 [Leptospira selangorensis]|uniref:Uncharacterized protein n=1 Tax=Leptospira selangorensis TaxID=2484982 RepID=A0A5F2C348_9LEPT|nr:hypothetical protein [Leptospira selangorensis]TGM13370.1 hypothetical protein EHQ81_11070 [Leptospira selangorensis]TGM22289.1 hypothetical protein EHQ82_07655 [Leptospira selangorensis]